MDTPEDGAESIKDGVELITSWWREVFQHIQVHGDNENGTDMASEITEIPLFMTETGIKT